jgi:hypothetical protein
MVASRSDALDTLQLAVSGAASRFPERVAVRNRALRARPMLARPGILVSNCPSRWQRDSPFCPPPRSAERVKGAFIRIGGLTSAFPSRLVQPGTAPEDELGRLRDPRGVSGYCTQP